MAGTNNFLVFNEANNPNFTMSDADYYADLYRINGLIPMIADPIAHNKMYRQWSIMISAVAGLIASMNYNASDSDLAILQANLKSAIEDVAEAKVDPRITTLENWKSSITATPAELNILDGVTASTSELNILDGAEISTTELNYLSGAKSNIQTQINNLSISAFIPLRQDSTAYAIGDVVKIAGLSIFQYLECVVAGTTGATMPAYADVGQMVTDNEVKWLVCDFRDSAPVGTIKQDLVKRDGWLKLNGATINVTDYPRLVSFLTANSLLNAYTATPDSTKFYYGDSNNETLLLPDFEGLFIENSASSTLDKVSAGLPNATGSFAPELIISDYQPSKNKITFSYATGVFSEINNWDTFYLNNSVASSTGSTDSSPKGLEFNLSNSNTIYGNSDTVQPPAVKFLPIIKY